MTAVYPRSAFLIPLDPVTRNQGYTNLCLWFATAKGMDIASIRAGDPQEYSEGYIAYRTKQNQGDGMGDVGTTFFRIADNIKRYGICKRSEFNPGTDWNQVPGLAADLHAQLELPIELIPIPTINDDYVDSLRRQICFGKVPLATFTFGDLFSLYTKGKPWRTHRLPPATASYYREHAMAFVGYDDDAQMFVCANSEGPESGDNGYIGIPYDQVRNGPEKVIGSLWLLQTCKYPAIKVDGFMPEIATLNAQEIAEARAAFKLKWTQNVSAIVPADPSYQQIIDGFRQLGGKDRHVEICFEMKRGDLRPYMQANGLTAPETFFEPF